MRTVCLIGALTLLLHGSVFGMKEFTPIDSLRQEGRDSVLDVHLFAAPDSIRSAGYAQYSLIDDHFRDGAPILYHFYGQVPGISSHFNFTDWGGAQPSYLYLDGMPFSITLLQQLPLSEFDISSATAIPGVTGSVGLGPIAGSGIVALTSKSGEGFEKTGIEANSYTGTLWYYDEPFTTQSTSVAVNKDFGKVDTRLSLNYSDILSSSVESISTKDSRAYFLSKTRFRLGRRVSGKVVLIDAPGVSHLTFVSQRENLFLSSLQLQYSPFSWLVASASLSPETIHISFDSDSGYRRNSALMGQVSLQAFKKFGKVSIAPCIGIQTIHLNSRYRVTNPDPLSPRTQTSVSKISTSEKFYSGGLKIGVGKSVYLAGMLGYGENENITSTKINSASVTTALIFTDWFILPQWWSSGKIRTGYSNQNPNLYETLLDAHIAPDVNTSGHGKMNSLEAGIDLAMIQNRITLSLSRFHNNFTQNPIYLGPPSTGPAAYLPNAYLVSNSMEGLLRCDILHSNSLIVQAKALFSEYSSIVYQESNADFGIQDPQETFGLGGQLISSRWQFGILATTKYVTYFTSASGMFEIHKDVNVTSLRDLSVAYSPVQSESLLHHFTFRLIGHNLLENHKLQDYDTQFLYPGVPSDWKEVDLNISATF